MKDMREAFETWAEKELLPLDKRDSEHYRYNLTNRAWAGWKAALSAVPAQECVTCKEHEQLGCPTAKTGIYAQKPTNKALESLGNSPEGFHASQAQQQITKDAIQHGTGIGLVVGGKLQHVKREDFHLSPDEIASQAQQEPAKAANLFEIVTHGESGDAWLLLRADVNLGLGHHCIKFDGAAADDLRKRFKVMGSIRSQAQQKLLKVSANWREPLSADAMQRLKNLGVLDKSPAPEGEKK